MTTESIDHAAIAQMFIDRKIEPSFFFTAGSRKGCVATALYMLETGVTDLTREDDIPKYIRSKYGTSYLEGLAFDALFPSLTDDPDFREGRSDRLKILALIHKGGVDIERIANINYGEALVLAGTMD